MPTNSSSEAPPLDREVMRRLPLFADLAEEDLERLYRMARPREVEAGERIIEEGTVGDALYVVLDGELEVTKHEAGREVVLATRGPGEFIGELSLLEQAPRSASVRALRAGRLLVVSRAAFQSLLACSPAAPLTVLRTVTARLRSTESLLMQQEKMAALGTLAAGLAHELNNPAAAIGRSADHLRGAIAGWGGIAAELGTLGLDPRQAAALQRLQNEAAATVVASGALEPLERSDREAEVQAWLEERGVGRAWEHAPVLVAHGWDRESLAPLDADFARAQLPVVVQWLTLGSTAAALIDEIGRSAAAISEIVGAVKRYSYLDQAPLQDVDVHESLENTLVILRHQLKGGVRVHREYAPDLPRIEAYGSELNQVWTNLIGNAVDAMQGRGELTLRTRCRAGQVVVEIIDTGPGIPPEVQPRIFEPFFTTKEPGQGTGLGLHIAYTIVVHRHRGQLRARSRPGETCFQVALPLRLDPPGP